MNRNTARRILMQSIFEMDARGSAEEVNIEPLLEESGRDSLQEEYIIRNLKNAADNLEEIDKMIEKNIARNWSFDRFDKVMQALLRLSVCELIFFDKIPANVIFNEYIEIAKSFFKKREVGFVNGILNSIFQQQKSV